MSLCLLVATAGLVPTVVLADQSRSIAPDAGSSDYEEQGRRARAAPDTADFAALRRAYVESWGSFGALGPGGIYQRTSALQRRFTQAMQGGDLKAAERALDELVTTDFANHAVHQLAAKHFESIGRIEDAIEHNEIRQRIFDAILASGDGRSAETAFPVIGLSEAHLVMQLLGLAASGNATANKRRVRYIIIFAEPGPATPPDRQEVWFRPHW